MWQSVMESIEPTAGVCYQDITHTLATWKWTRRARFQECTVTCSEDKRNGSKEFKEHETQQHRRKVNFIHQNSRPSAVHIPLATFFATNFWLSIITMALKEWKVFNEFLNYLSTKCLIRHQSPALLSVKSVCCLTLAEFSGFSVLFSVGRVNMLSWLVSMKTEASSTFQDILLLI